MAQKDSGCLTVALKLFGCVTVAPFGTFDRLIMAQKLFRCLKVVHKTFWLSNCGAVKILGCLTVPNFPHFFSTDHNFLRFQLFLHAGPPQCSSRCGSPRRRIRDPSTWYASRMARSRRILSASATGRCFFCNEIGDRRRNLMEKMFPGFYKGLGTPQNLFSGFRDVVHILILLKFQWMHLVRRV